VSEALTFLAPAFVLCLVIASLHVYLGMHILAREVIFVDLALAQLAALGTTAASLLQAHEHGEQPGLAGHGGALALTVLGAAIFALFRKARRSVSQEAIVGIVYALASALMVLALSRAPHGAERIKDMLIGTLLVATWDEVLVTALVYLVLAAAQFALRRRFIALSWQAERADRELPHAVLWDFAFYVLFGIAITISVQLAGVLLVFSFLIVPAVITQLFGARLVPRLLYGWLVAALASVAGLWASWVWDLPTGAAIVVAFGALLVLAIAGRAVLRPA
jgi:zinc/manganese transport system permease protein